jgi:hypothetical protein
MINEAKNLLNHNWEEEERVLIQKVIDNLIYYKKFIPNSLKDDVKSILDMANKIKIDYDNLLECNKKCTCKEIKPFGNMKKYENFTEKECMIEIGVSIIFEYNSDSTIKSIKDNIEKLDVKNAKTYLSKDIVTISFPENIIQKAIKIIDEFIDQKEEN